MPPANAGGLEFDGEAQLPKDFDGLVVGFVGEGHKEILKPYIKAKAAFQKDQ